MADVNKPKLQLRSGLPFNGDKTPSPATKLLISHGKPNFTIQRSPKIQNGNENPMSPPVNNNNNTTNNLNNTTNNSSNNNEFVVKSTTFNGVFKPANISVATKQTLQQNGNGNSTDNEAAKVVLRRAKVVEVESRDGEDDNVPEFIRRQRRIQERLANQNILDFESRRSGYFTQVMISPTNPNRQSFVETMTRPAVMPSLEIPPPTTPEQHKIEEEKLQEQTEAKQKIEEKIEEIQQELKQSELQSEDVVLAVPVTLNGQDEEEEVAKAIEEVNKAVAGEDDDKIEVEHSQETEHLEQPLAVAATTLEHVEEIKPAEPEVVKSVEETPVAAVEIKTPVEEASIVAAVVTSALVEEDPQPVPHIHVEAVVTSAPLIEEHVEAAKTNGVVEETLQNGHSNGHSNGHASDNEITISHTNGLNGPSIPSPDPSGEKGVNYEPKTVVSFSQELGSDVNKYPDTVKVTKDVETSKADEELRELTKLKFEIKGDDKDVEVKSVLVTETS